MNKCSYRLISLSKYKTRCTIFQTSGWGECFFSLHPIIPVVLPLFNNLMTLSLIYESSISMQITKYVWVIL